MKNSKLNFICLYCAFISFFFLITYNSYSQTPDCFNANRPPGVICFGWSSEPPLEIELDAFPGCKIMITYSVNSCLNNNCVPAKVTKEISIGSIHWDWEDPNCSAFSVDVIPGYPNNFGSIDEVKLMQYFAEIKDKLALEIFIKFYDNEAPPNQDIYDCSHWASMTCPFMITMSEAACQGYCHKQILSNEDSPLFDPNNPLTWQYKAIVYPLPCYSSELSCCLKTYKMCMDENGVPVVTFTTDLIGSNCSELIMPVLSCSPVRPQFNESSGVTECHNICPN